MDYHVEQVLFGDPFFGEVVTQLAPVDILTMQKVHPIYHKIPYHSFEKSVGREINKRLRNIFEDKYDEFRKVIAESGAIITGSFIIQCILGEDWNTDIDIYVPTKGVELFETTYINNFGPHHYTGTEDFMYANMAYTNYYNSNSYGDDLGSIIKWIREYNFYKKGVDPIIQKIDIFNWGNKDLVTLLDKTKPSIQVIQIDIEKDYTKLKDFIINNFDFDICKNVFHIDGDGKDTLYIHRPNDIINKKTPFKIGKRLGSSLGRCQRYQERGFQFDTDMTTVFDDLIEKSTSCDDPRYAIPCYRVFEVVDLNKKVIKNIRKNKKLELSAYKFVGGNRDHLLESGAKGDDMILEDDDLFIKQNGYYTYYNDGGCHDGCPVELCFGPGQKKHFHLKGIHTGHGAYTTYIMMLKDE